MTRMLAVLLAAVLCAGCAGMTTGPAGPGTVKITPLGSHDGEFCVLDRALVLEDPDGTRILYDAGNTVRGTNDPRLGKIDAVLLPTFTGTIWEALTSPPPMRGTAASPTSRSAMCPPPTR